MRCVLCVHVCSLTLSHRSVEVLLKKFHDHHVDQIYVVDEKSAPIGLVTVHDLLRVLQS
jgi:CBS domain-containing protein